MSKRSAQMSQRAQARAVPVQRENEGARVPVILSTSASVKGMSLQLAAIKLGDAPVPERKYVADLCGIDTSPGTVRLLFAQKKIGAQDLRSMLVIQMTELGAARFLSGFDQLAPLTMSQMAKEHGLVSEPIMKIASEPAQTVALAAALTLVAAVPDEATLDFYQASAFAFGSVSQTNTVLLDPVVRVDIRPQLVLGLIEGLKELDLPKMELTELPK